MDDRDDLRQQLLHGVKEVRDTAASLTTEAYNFLKIERTEYGPWRGQAVVAIGPEGNGGSLRNGRLNAAVELLQEAGEDPVRLGGVVLVKLTP